MDLSIIIINYNSYKLTCECIDRVIKYTEGISFEIILIDNNSTEVDPGLFEQMFPSIRLIRSKENVGFSRANNLGIRASVAEAVLLLNPDAWVEDNSIANCCRVFLKSEYVACGVQLLNSDRTYQISGNYFIMGGINQLLSLPYTGRFIRWLGYAFGVKKTNVPEAHGKVEVDWANGAFLMAKKQVIEQAGLMDEDFFLYFEEIEWCSRLRKFGRLCIFGDFKVLHLLGATTTKVFKSGAGGYDKLDDRKGLQIMVSALLRIRKQYGVGWFLFHLAAYLFTILIYFIAMIFTFPSQTRSSWKQFRGYISNCWRLLLISRRIVSGKPHFYKML